MNELEKNLERYLVNRVKQFGGKCIKMVPTYENGIPDRLVCLRGRTVFVELKRKGEKPRALQVQYMEELKAAGQEVAVIDSREQVEQLIADILRNPKTVTEL
jgi:hypothetical protein